VTCALKHYTGKRERSCPCSHSSYHSAVFFCNWVKMLCCFSVLLKSGFAVPASFSCLTGLVFPNYSRLSTKSEFIVFVELFFATNQHQSTDLWCKFVISGSHWSISYDSSKIGGWLAVFHFMYYTLPTQCVVVLRGCTGVGFVKHVHWMRKWWIRRERSNGWSVHIVTNKHE